MMTDPGRGAPELPVHVPVEVAADEIRSGAATRRFQPHDTTSLLSAYLTLIRGLRDQRRARSIELRSRDIEVLAEHLDLPGEVVVGHLADLMGATRAQRRSMVSLFGAGALVIGLAGSVATGTRATPAAPMPGGSPVAPAVHVTPTRPPTTSGSPTTAVAGPSTTSTTAAPATTTVAAPDPVATTSAPEIPDPVPASTPRTEPAPAVQPPVADDTVVTDIGTPPVPPSPDATTPPDDTDDTVITDIGTPPVPPSPDTTTPPTSAAPGEPVVTDIGTPPVPPSPDATAPPTSAAADAPAAPTTSAAPGDTVVTDIGTPPVPPTSPAATAE